MFVLSLALILFSSYLIISAISGGKRFFAFLYFVLVAFSQTILSCEVLSLFGKIGVPGFLICNIVFLVISAIIFKKSGKKFYIPEVADEINKIKAAMKRDRFLSVFALCFFVFIALSLFTVLFYPVLFGDALNYYFPRALMWLQQGNISHFVTPDTRELIMPVNFDLLYMLHYMFFKTEQGIAIYSFVGYLTVIYVLYFTVKEIGFTTRRALWSIFIFSAFALVTIEAVAPCSELVAGGLLLASVLLFIVNAKHDDKTALFFSALSAALAIGIKTTAIMSLPALIFLFCAVIFAYKPKKPIQRLFGFAAVFLLCFVLFSAYNYVLNYIDFKNPVSNSEQLQIHAFRGGFKGWLCNFIKYCFMIFDNSGNPLGLAGVLVTKLQNAVLTLFNLDEASYASPHFPGNFEYNISMSILSCVLGSLGLFVFLPALVQSFKRIKKRARNIICAAFAISLIINIALLSKAMIFAQFNNKYLVTFVVIASPVLAYSYILKKGFYKYFVAVLVFWYFISHPLVKPVNLLLYAAGAHDKPFIDVPEERIYNKIKALPKGKILLTAKTKHSSYNYFVKPVLDGYYIQNMLPETIREKDISDFDYILAASFKMSSSIVVKSGLNGDRAQGCLYLDNDKIPVTPNNPVRPVTVECMIPFDYYAQNGFKKIYEDGDFVLMQRNAG